MAELSDLDIDRLLSEAELRLSSRPSQEAVVPATEAPQIAAPPAPVLGEGTSQQPQLQTSQAPANDVGLRIPVVPGRKKKKDGPDDAGPDWYNLPRTDLTEDLKKDLQLLRMRDVLANGKQFFKKDTSRKLVPDFCAVGTLVEGPTDGVNGRLTRKERKRTIVEEVLSSGDALDKYKRRYGTIQEKKSSGRKGHYKKLVAGRRRKG